MNDVSLLDALRADRALVGLTPTEELELRRLAGGEPLDDPTFLAATAVDLATLGALEPLPVALRARLLSGLPAGAPPAAEAPAAPPARRTAWLGWAVAACFAILAVVAALRPRPEPAAPRVAASSPSPSTSTSVSTVPSAVASTPRPADRRDALLARADARRTPFAATKDPGGAGAAGDVVWSSAAQEGYMTFRGLPANDPHKSQYQLWIFDADRDDRFPVDGGVFDVPAGVAEVVVPIAPKLRAQRPKLFAVTVEPPGGVVVSKREHIVLTASPAPP